jgi:hypothetical protein
MTFINVSLTLCRFDQFKYKKTSTKFKVEAF